MGLPYGENYIILTSTVFSRPYWRSRLCYSVVSVCRRRRRRLWRYVLWL